MVPLAPSHGANKYPTRPQVRGMDKSDIADVRRWHRDAALRARQAGADIVYVYAAHNIALPMHFLLSQEVVGLRLSYVSAVGAGGAAFLLPNQWNLLGKLRTIPDTVDDFTGYSIDVDFWAWTLPGVDATRKYSNGGRANVRNVTLPAGYNHVVVPVTHELPKNPVVRAWLDAYVPGAPPWAPPENARNILWAAGVWYSVKKRWVLGAQRQIRAKRAGTMPAIAGKLE
jgi:hypothetical protein